jgi:folate-binding protein YgfZ
MENVPLTVPLDDLGVLRARGPDAVPFLQGQLSNDVAKLGPDRSLLAGYHNPQGRVIALLRLVHLGPDDLLALLPRELALLVASRLSKFVLRAKVKIDDQSDGWQVRGLIEPRTTATETDAAAAAQAPSLTGASAIVRVDPTRSLIVTPRAAAAVQSHAVPLAANPHAANGHASDVEAWHRLDIAAGLPQVYASTSEEFVAQMLNLDVLDAVAFDKGCYTGQEVIARAHYRGRVKRRLQRFATRSQLAALAPGAAGQLSDGRSFKVVDSVQLADGRVEFLAVAPTRAGEADEAAPSAAAEHGRVDAEQLPLPYALPD